MDRAKPGWFVGMTLLLIGCGGGGDDAPPPGTPAAEAPPPTAEVAATQQGDSAAQTDSGPSTQLVREAFAYAGSGRDPFASLLRSGDVRPFPQDLRVRAINYDPRYPQRSVATVQDTSVGRRYTLRLGDQVGRIRVVQIRATEIVIAIEEFGVERQVVLSIRRRQEDIP